MDYIKVWVILLGLPLLLSESDILMAIRNKTGAFVRLELGWDTKLDYRWA